ncbi:hypothetical protein MUU72_22600 [Streptomyces sp. RS10V-4]|uniref:hypothetical protein n=1 Tax=Streptomyces rhizoryzae TaxID=2932493 RepID=UPI002004DB5A|nr:hypothetical protein [Streptomyces rhizoryzae]MCK7625858.1 hypothetical protein [Streptomyces rhizoryzae]
MNGAKIGVALAGGYVLGRTKKAKLAIGLGMYLAGKRLSPDPQQLKKLVADSPLFGQLNDQVRRELLDATKSAAATALTRRMSGLADSLHERTRELEGGRPDAEADEDEDGAKDAPKGEDTEEDGEEDAAAESSGRPARSGRAARSSKTSSRAKAAASSKPSRSAERGARTAKSGARKSTSGARKAAARKGSGRGGSDE